MADERDRSHLRLVPPMPPEPTGEEEFELRAEDDLPMIARERYLALIEQLAADWKLSERGVLRRLESDETRAAQLRKHPGKGVGLNEISRVCAKIGLSRDYFFTESDGPIDYASWIVTTVERDADRSPYPNFETFIGAAKKIGAITPAQMVAMRAVRYDSGERSATMDAAREELARIVREQSGRAMNIATTTKPSRSEELAREGKPTIALKGRKKGE